MQAGAFAQISQTVSGASSGHLMHFSGSTPDTDVQLQWPLNNSYYMNVDLKILVSPETNAAIFWGHQFAFMNGAKGYLGYGVGGTIKVATFAVFDAIAGNTNNPSGSCSSTVPFSPIGSGWSCFIEYNWKLGFNYGLRLAAQSKDSSGNQWWQASVYDYSTNAETFIGNILAPASFNLLSSSSSTWVEYSIYTVCNVPYTRVVFSYPYARNAAGDHAPLKAKVTYGSSSCQDSNVQYLGGGAYVAEAGQNVVRTIPGQTWLWTQEPAIVHQPIPEFSLSMLVAVLGVAFAAVVYSKRLNKKTRR